MNEIITSKHERRELQKKSTNERRELQKRSTNERRELQKWRTNGGVACIEEVIETETKW
jgi:hypothetical protein